MTSEFQSRSDRRILHEAEVWDDAGDALDHFDDLRNIIIRNPRGFLNQHGDGYHTLMQNMIVLDELRQRERHTVCRVGATCLELVPRA